MGMNAGEVGEYVYEYKHIGVPSSGHNSMDRLAQVNEQVLIDGWEVWNTVALGLNARDYTVVYCLRRKTESWMETGNLGG